MLTAEYLCPHGSDGCFSFLIYLNSNWWLNRIIFSDLTEVFIKAITHLVGHEFVFGIRPITAVPLWQWMVIFSSKKKGKYYQSHHKSTFSLTLWKSVCIFSSWQTGLLWLIVQCLNFEFNWVVVCNQHDTSLLLVSYCAFRRIGLFWVPQLCFTEINHWPAFNFNSNAQCLLLVSSWALRFWAWLLVASRCSLIIPSVID